MTKFTVSKEERAAFEMEVARAMQGPVVLAKAEEIKANYFIDKGAEVAAEDNIPLDVAIERVKQSQPRKEGNAVYLPQDFLLDMGDHFVKAGDLLDPEIGPKYDQRSMPDPYEGRKYGRGNAKFYFNRGLQPCINSLAHNASTNYFIEPFPRCETTVVLDLDATSAEPKREETDVSSVRSSLLDQYSLTGDSQRLEQQLKAERFVLPGVAVQGQSTIIFSKPNCGKTLLAVHMIKEAVSADPDLKGRIYYVNADDSYGGLVQKVKLAEEIGFHMLAPGEKKFSANSLLAILQELNRRNQSSEVIALLDTGKKFVDLMSKTDTAYFTKVARQFIQKGGTLIILAHTNKNLGPDGKPVPEGTADLLNDMDCAYLLFEVSRDEENQEKYVKAENIKNRGSVIPVAAFKYSVAPGLSYDELLASVQPVDPADLADAEQAQEAQDEAAIVEAVTAAINAGITAKMQLRDEAANRCGATRRQVLQVIERNTGTDPTQHRWFFTRGERGRMTFALHELGDAPVASEQDSGDGRDGENNNEDKS